jgi:hypothetical protein
MPASVPFRWAVILPLAIAAAVVLGPLAQTAVARAESPLLSSHGHVAELARILAPAPDALLRGAPVRFVVRLRPQARRFGAWLGGTEVTARFRARRGGLRVALIPRSLLRRGINHLVVRTRDGSGGRDPDSVSFVLARRDRGLVTPVTPRARRKARASGTLAVAFRLRRPPDRFRVRLNGRDVSHAVPGGLLRRGRLAADDGLRFGRNRLYVVARTDEGTWDAARHRVVVSRARPLAAAGRSATVVAGTRIRLDGRRSRTTRPGARLRYSWRIVRRPERSRATLNARRARRPALGIDVAGTYRIALTVEERSATGHLRGRALDVSEVTATPDLPPMGARVVTTRTGITLGGQTYPVTPGSTYALAVRRDTLEKFNFGVFSSGQQGLFYEGFRCDVEKAAKNQGVDVLWIGYGPPGCCAGVTANNGFTEVTFFDHDAKSDPITLMNDGMSLRNPDKPDEVGDPGGIVGWLQVDYQGRYTLIRPPYLRFDSSSDSGPLSNVMTINGRPYSSQLVNVPAGTSGFQVLALERANLDPLAGFPKAYPTNSGFPDFDDHYQQTMANDLKAALDQGAFVVVQSIGTPYPTRPSWAGIAAQLERMGASGHVFNTLDGSVDPGAPKPLSYAVAGCVGCQRAAESSYPLTRAKGAGSVAGLLARDGDWRWDLYLRDAGLPNGKDVDYRLAQIAYQDPVSWPAGASPGQLKALEFLHPKLGLKVPSADVYCYRATDVRTAYCNDLIDWGADKLPLLPKDDKIASLAQQCGCSADDLAAVVKQLRIEFLHVDQVNELLKTGGRIDTILARAFPQSQGDIQTIADDITAAVQMQASGQQRSSWVEYVAWVFEVASEVAPFVEEAEFFGALAGVVGSTLGLAGDTTNDGASDFRFAADKLGTEMSNAFNANAAQRGHIHNLIVTDWGKLSTVGPLVDGDWGDNPAYTPHLYNILRLGQARWAWQKLLGGGYGAYLFYPPRPGYRVNDLWCEFTAGSGGKPFEDESNWASWTPIDHFDSNMNGGYSFWLALGAGDFRSRNFKIPPGNIVERIFRPTDPPNTVAFNFDPLSPGLQKPFFYRRAQWAYITDVRPDSHRSTDGIWTPNNCNWGIL